MKEKQISTSWIKLVKDFIYQRHISPLTIHHTFRINGSLKLETAL